MKPAPFQYHAPTTIDEAVRTLAEVAGEDGRVLAGGQSLVPIMPTVRETPKVDVILREDYTSPLNPLGIKGAGESGITGVGAAIASAIDDAIGMPGAVTQLPVTPQRLKQILNGRSS